jgi:leucyl-tRNA synthetase
LLSTIRSTEDAAAKRKAKKNKGVASPAVPSVLSLYLADKFPKWQEDVIAILKNTFDGKAFVGDIAAMKESGLLKDKRVMPFAAQIKVYYMGI